jgi:hypothetical protein
VVHEAIADNIPLVGLHFVENLFRDVNTESGEHAPVIVHVLLMRSGIVVIEVGVNRLFLIVANEAEDEVKRTVVAESYLDCIALGIDSSEDVLRHDDSYG